MRDMTLSTPPPTARTPAFSPAAPTPPRAPRKRIKPPQAASAPVVLAEEEAVEPAVQSSSIPELPEPPEPPVAAVPAPQVESVVVAQPASAPVDVASTPVADSPGATAAAPTAAASAPTMASFEWPVSTRVSYVLTGNYRGEVSGNAQVEWIRAGSRYQVHLDLSVGPSFAPLITRRMSSDGEITAAGLTPRRYDQDTKVVMSDRQRVNVQFESDVVVLANGERRASIAGVGPAWR